MVKKFSYLVSVSVLASSLLSSASHAVYENELIENINNFCVRQRATHIDSSPSSSSSTDNESSSFWNTAYTAGGVICSGIGNSLRYLGDTVRGESFAGDILTKNAVSLAKTVKYSGVSETIDAVQADEGALKSLRKTGGNALRYVGALVKGGETPTLERAIRKFWKGKTDDIEDVFTSTSCALYLSQEIKSVDEIKLNYRKFTDAWNNSSYAVPCLDAGKNVEYFLKGIIRGFVMQEQDMSSFDLIAPQMAALGITYKNLSATRTVTVEKLPSETRKERIAQARQDAFMKFVGETYEVEFLRKRANQMRMTSSQVPSALPAPHPLFAIEYDPHHGDSSSAAGDEREAEQVD